MFIDKGEVIEQGTHEELIAQKGRYYHLVLENEPSMAPRPVAATDDEGQIEPKR